MSAAKEEPVDAPDAPDASPGAAAALIEQPSTGAPLREPMFRMLWFAWLAANVTMWMNDVASAWLMTSLTDSVVMVALVQAASTLPVFVLGLPSGALADIIDRRRYFAFTQLWVASIAVVLGVLSFFDGLTAPGLLALTFANGIGMAMRWPVFAAIVPEVVSRSHLPAALALNGIAMNMSRVIGPVVAGALLASAGSQYVFLLNALLSVAAFVLILRWRSQRKTSALPGERFLGAMRVGLQHVQQSPRMRAVLVRIFLFFLQTTALTALLPLIARQLGGGASTFTLLLAAMGVGAVIVALFLLPMLRGRLGRDEIVRWGTVVHACAAVIVVLSPTIWLAVPAMMVAGMMWLTVANSLTLAAQMALPNWVRARGMSIYQMSLMGGSAAGAALWGYVASHSSVASAVIASAIVGPLLLLMTRRLVVGDDGRRRPDADQRQLDAPPPVIELQGDEGPVMVTVEYQIDPTTAAEFAAGDARDAARPAAPGRAVMGTVPRYRPARAAISNIFVDENWVEHQRRLERFTAADVGLRARRLAFHRRRPMPPRSRAISPTASMIEGEGLATTQARQCARGASAAVLRDWRTSGGESSRRIRRRCTWPSRPSQPAGRPMLSRGSRTAIRSIARSGCGSRPAAGTTARRAPSACERISMQRRSSSRSSPPSRRSSCVPHRCKRRRPDRHTNRSAVTPTFQTTRQHPSCLHDSVIEGPGKQCSGPVGA